MKRILFWLLVFLFNTLLISGDYDYPGKPLILSKKPAIEDNSRLHFRMELAQQSSLMARNTFVNHDNLDDYVAVVADDQTFLVHKKALADYRPQFKLQNVNDRSLRSSWQGLF